MKIFAFVTMAMLALFYINGCGAAKPLSRVNPSGKTGYTVECGHDIIQCLDDAGKICRSGFDIVAVDSLVGGFVTPKLSGSGVIISMLYECK